MEGAKESYGLTSYRSRQYDDDDDDSAACSPSSCASRRKSCLKCRLHMLAVTALRSRP